MVSRVGALKVTLRTGIYLGPGGSDSLEANFS